MPRRTVKQLLCPVCGDVLAEAEYVAWRGRLVLRAYDGRTLAPSGSALLLRVAEREAVDAGDDGERDAAAARARYVRSKTGELIYDLRCPRGHTTLCAMPRVRQLMKRTAGAWVTLVP